MVVGAAALLVVSLLAAYFAGVRNLPDVSLGWEVAFLSLVLLPLMFSTVLLALPLRRRLGDGLIGALALGLAAATAILEVGGLDLAANFTKFAAVSAAGWWFLGLFESVGWVLLVAVLIVPVDIVSVARGPTKTIVEEQPEIFDVLSIAFPVPGEETSAQLGLPDVLFFALFLGACERFGLRTRATWLAMALSFGATLALAVWWDVGGLPALPLLSVAFVLVNLDRLWLVLRPRGEPA